MRPARRLAAAAGRSEFPLNGAASRLATNGPRSRPQRGGRDRRAGPGDAMRFATPLRSIERCLDVGVQRMITDSAQPETDDQGQSVTSSRSPVMLLPYANGKSGSFVAE